MPKNDFGFLKYMPEFAKTFKTSPLYDEKLMRSDALDEMDASQAEDETETRTAYLKEEDFSWYTENILKKFPEAT